MPAHNVQTAVDGVDLRAVVRGDLAIFFEQQRDAQANEMAAFAAPNPADRRAFDEHWRRLLKDTAVNVRCIVSGTETAGYIVGFERLGQREVGYWLGRRFWGRGIATQALTIFLRDRPAGPLHARAAADNHASIRVLQKCGFEIRAHAKAFANARAQTIPEVIFIHKPTNNPAPQPLYPSTK